MLIRRAAPYALAVVLGLGAPATAGPTPSPRACRPLVLPKPTGPIPVVRYPDLPIERTRVTFVPGPVTDDEQVEVLVGPDGAPSRVKVRQRLHLTGTGDYSVRVRGPSLRVTPLEDTVAPVIIRGAVVWQGFSPGERLLSAEMELDPRREALLLPVILELDWTSAGGEEIGPGGRLPGAGRLTLRLVNQSVQPLEIPVGTGADPASLAAGLDALLAYADGPAGRPAPAVGRDLPGPGQGACVTATRTVDTVAQLRVEGTVRVPGVPGVTVNGPGAQRLPEGDGASLRGVLSGTAEVVLDVPAAGELALDLTVHTTLDPRALRPPAPAATWHAWAAAGPSASEVDRALETLISAAATLARNDDKAPYLGHHGPGPTSTVFHYGVAPAPVARRKPPPLRPRPLPIALTGLGLAVLTAAGVVVWRRS
jgi:hypothetical protein